MSGNNIQLKTLVDIDSHILELYPQRLPTDYAKSRHTYLVRKVEYAEYWSEDWHRQILEDYDHVPEPRNYTSNYDLQHCPACYAQLDEAEQKEYSTPDEDGNLEPVHCTQETYHMSLLAVNPGIQTAKGIESAVSSIGEDKDFWDALSVEGKIELLVDVGNTARLWEQAGVDLGDLRTQADAAYKESLILGGFKLDRAQNAIGSTGWDFLVGDVTGGLR